MTLQLIRADITTLEVDAIVNAANEKLLGGGGVDGAIHKAAGPKLLEECRTLGGCKTGEAKLTKGYKLPAKYVIHTVGPVWQDGKHDEQKLLEACYANSLRLAVEHDCQSIAFPLISAGAYNYPKYSALQVATQVIRDFLAEQEQELLVYLVLFDSEVTKEARQKYKGLAEYIDDNYVEAHYDRNIRSAVGNKLGDILWGGTDEVQRASLPADAEAMYEEESLISYSFERPRAKTSLEDELAQLDESFTQMLMRKIDEAGIKDSECYRKANVDRRLFSKIRSDIHYHPRKQTAVALAIGLKLNLEETRSLLEKAGYALTHANKFDIIVEYFIKRGEYDVDRINYALLDYDQPILG